MKINKGIKKLMGLSIADLKVFNLLYKNLLKQYDTEQMSNKLKVNKTTVQRAVKKLYEIDFITKKQINLDGGGYKFIYMAKSEYKIRIAIEKKLKGCFNEM